MTTTPLTRPTAPATPGHPRRWAGLAVLAASLLVVVMDMTVLNVALPALAAETGASALQQLWIVDAYPLVLAGLLVPVTALADRVGRKRMLLTGFAIFAVASTVVLWVDTAGTVIALRVALGLGGAMIMPSTLSLIRTLFPDPQERAYALGLWAAMASLGAAVGPVVGGALLEVWSWHAAFLVNVPLMLVAIAAGLWLLPESRSERPGRIDLPGVVLTVGGMVALVYGVKELGKVGLGPVPVGGVLLGALLLTVFVRRSLGQTDPMLAVSLFRLPLFRAGVVAALASSITMMALLFVGSQWLQLVQGWGPLLAGVALLPLAVSGLVASPLAPAIASRFGARRAVVLGLLLLAAGPLVLFLTPRPMPYLWVAVALTLVGLGTGALALASALIVGSAPQHQVGSAAAVEEICYELGAVLSISVLGGLTAALYRGGLPGSASADARESLALALDTPVAAAAQAAYTDAFAWVGLAGALLMLVAAWLVHRLLPADLDLAELEH
ncbi:MFS transporter [Marmoricola sp. Leaf446]|uniref:MFS transporter n=1 Tax=Marmoricola sp. Leaf446 TaxID=1736379 RepID=UPI0006F2E85A|nr:MFS transporter [Marmoricola sp. Leaf446]KQT92086.1 MFS transporter [Marmoricola sp. Leaf446]